MAALKNNYGNLTANLKGLLCPLVAREQYFLEFEHKVLRPEEDPALYLHDLQQMLFTADPNLGDSARNALLSRQVMNGFSPTLCFKLLEHNPTSIVKEMQEFIHCFRATQHAHGVSHTCASSTHAEPPQDH